MTRSSNFSFVFLKQWFGQFFDEKVPFSEIGIMDNQVNDTPHTERRH